MHPWSLIFLSPIFLESPNRDDRPAPTPKRHPPRRHAVGGPARTLIACAAETGAPRPPFSGERWRSGGWSGGSAL